MELFFFLFDRIVFFHHSQSIVFYLLEKSICNYNSRNLNEIFDFFSFFDWAEAIFFWCQISKTNSFYPLFSLSCKLGSRRLTLGDMKSCCVSYGCRRSSSLTFSKQDIFWRKLCPKIVPCIIFNYGSIRVISGYFLKLSKNRWWSMEVITNPELIGRSFFLLKC